MAKTVEQHKQDIERQREKIKTAEAAIKKSEALIQQLEESELITLARQLRAAGKLQDAKKLLAVTEAQIDKPATTQSLTADDENEIS